MIFPPGSVLGTVEEQERQPSRTYRLDLEKGRIRGTVDGLEAVKQAVYKILDTSRFALAIYSANYGLEKRVGAVYSVELERLVRDALLQDDRITAVENFSASIDGDEAKVSFTVVSIFGSLGVERRI